MYHKFLSKLFGHPARSRGSRRWKWLLVLRFSPCANIWGIMEGWKIFYNRFFHAEVCFTQRRKDAGCFTQRRKDAEYLQDG